MHLECIYSMTTVNTDEINKASTHWAAQQVHSSAKNTEFTKATVSSNILFKEIKVCSQTLTLHTHSDMVSPIINS